MKEEMLKKKEIELEKSNGNGDDSKEDDESSKDITVKDEHSNDTSFDKNGQCIYAYKF